MPRKRRYTKRPEMLSRNVELSSFSASIRTTAEERRGEAPRMESRPWIELTGKLEEPVRDVEDIRIGVYREDTPQVGTARPASIGAIIGMRPEMSVVLSWSHLDFDRLWAFTPSTRVAFAYLYFAKPRYGKGLVVSASSSTEREE